MSTTIDERVVQMSFDNKEFERNVRTSMSTIERLKQSLNLTGASRGLENVSDAARNVDMSGVSGAVETVRLKFSALEVAAVTALANISNSAFAAGKRFLESFTTEPIKTGFQEYETQMNAVQTILANTSSAQTEVSKEAVQAINEAAKASADATVKASEAAIEELKDLHDDAVDAFNDAADDARDALRKTQKQELKVYQKSADAAIKSLRNAEKAELAEYQNAIDAKLEAFDEAADEELDILEDKYDEESKALDKAIKQELSALKSAHQTKLNLYKDEYLEKLRLTDEERYNKLKAIEDEIASLKGLTEAEEEANKEAERSRKLAELQSRVDNALGLEERIKAETALANYKEEIAKEDLLKEREAKIEALEASKDAINDEYDLITEQLKAEYESKKAQENELYALEMENLKEEQSERRNALRETYNEERELLKKQQDEKRKVLRETLVAEKEAIGERYDAEIEALKELQELEIDSIRDRQEAEEKALRRQQKLEKEALLEQQKAELEAMDANLEIALQNVEAEKVAQIKALSEVKDAANSKQPTTLEDVNKALDELNKYADKTIYNFTEMTRNIGTFTAAGVDLDTSVAAIKGIANLAAVSGSSSQQASTAMYQLSQAISSGTVRLMDWNSVQNAGMGGQLFQNALLETARVHGIAVDQMIAENGSFRDSLQEEWLSSDILLETLQKFTGDLTEAELEAMGYTEEQIKGIVELGKTANDAATKVKTFTQLTDTLKETAQSGWTQSWEIIIGDFEEAKELWTEVNQVFGAFIDESARARNDMLQGWKDLGGRTVLIDAFRNAFEGIVSVITPIKDAFREIFPRTTSEQLLNMTTALRDFMAQLKLTDTQSENLKRTFKGLFSILDIVKQAFSAVWNTVKPLFGGIGGLLNSVIELTASWGDWLAAQNESIRKNDAFNKALSGLKKVVVIVADGIGNLGETIKTFISHVKENFTFPGFELFHELLERLHERMGMVGEATGNMRTGLDEVGQALSESKLVQVLTTIWEAVKEITGAIFGAVGDIAGKVTDKLGDANFEGALDVVNTLSIGGIALALKKFVDNMTKSVDNFTGIFGNIKGVLTDVRGCFEAYQSQLKAGTLLKIAGAIAILTASVLVLSLIDSDKLNSSISAMTALFTELVISMTLFTKLSGSLKGALTTSVMMIAMAAAIAILAGSMKALSTLDWEGIAKGVVGIGALAAIVVASANLMSSDTKQMIKGTVGLVLFAAAIKVLASACKDLSGLSWEELGKGLAGVGALLAELAIFMNVAKFGGKAISTGIGILVLSAGIKVLASACADFGVMSWDVIGRGLTAMAGALAAVVIAVRLMPKNMMALGTGLVLVGGALLIVANALRNMGGMSWEEIGKGLAAMGGSLLVLAVGLKAMKKTLSGAAALLVASAALAVLAPVLSLLGAMSWEGIAKSLITLAGAFTVIGVAGAVLGPLVPAIIGLAGALALIGVSVLGVGVGLATAATGFAALATVGAAGAMAVGAALTVIITSIIGVIPVIAEKIGEAIITFCQVIIEGAPAVGEAFLTILTTIINVLVESIPKVVAGVLSILTSVLKLIAEYTPQIISAVVDVLLACLRGIADNIQKVVETGIEIVTEFLAGISEKLPDVIQAGFDLLISFLQGITDAINNNTEVMVETVKGLFLALIGAAIEVLNGAIELIWEAGKKLIDSGLIQGIWDKLGALKNKLGELMAAAIGKITEKLTEWKHKGKELISNVITGIGEKLTDIKNAVGELIRGAKEAITNKFTEWKTIGGDLIKGFIEGIKGMASSIKDAALGVIEGAVDSVKDFLGINSPSRLFMEIGRYSDEGLIAGLEHYAGGVTDAAEGVANGAVDAMSVALASISDLINSDMDTTPTIRPVLDMSNVEAGASRLNALFSREQAMSISSSMRGVDGSGIQNGANSMNGTTYQFTQNNYSPKALSRVEIYRQTRNQFSAIERMATS